MSHSQFPRLAILWAWANRCRLSRTAAWARVGSVMSVYSPTVPPSAVRRSWFLT